MIRRPRCVSKYPLNSNAIPRPSHGHACTQSPLWRPWQMEIHAGKGPEALPRATKWVLLGGEPGAWAQQKIIYSFCKGPSKATPLFMTWCEPANTRCNQNSPDSMFGEAYWSMVLLEGTWGDELEVTHNSHTSQKLARCFPCLGLRYGCLGFQNSRFYVHGPVSAVS